MTGLHRIQVVDHTKMEQNTQKNALTDTKKQTDRETDKTICLTPLRISA